MNLFIMPHPPLAIEEIGQGKENQIKDTVNSMEGIGEQIKSIAPKTIAVISPHGNVFSDGLCINIESNLWGDFSEFHQPNLSINARGDFQKALVFCSGLRASGINCLALDEVMAKKYDITTNLDHGVMVPLYYVQKHYMDFKLLHINIGYLPKTQMYEAGKILAEILDEGDVVIASGDLSHRLSKENVKEYDEMGAVYDKHIKDSIINNEFLNILSTDDIMLQRAGQCAQKPLEMLIGVMDGCSTKGRVYSYEAPFGVGYLTAAIECIKTDKDHLINQYLRVRENINEENRLLEDEYVKLAKDTIAHYVKNKTMPHIPDGLSEDMYIKQRGVFVSIKREGRLRGCIGTMTPTKASLAQEVMHNAVEAATKDSRFTELQEEELSEIEVFVDVLSDLEPVKNKDELDIKEYGVVVKKDTRRGLLLPNLDGVKSVDHQIEIVLEKAGIKKDEEYIIQRFKVDRHKRPV